MEIAETKHLERAPARGPVAALFDLPTDEVALLRHYTLSDDDIEHIRVRHGGHNRLGFALRIGRQGEIRDRSSEGQHYRMAGLNLLTAIVIYWNTAHLGEAIRQRKHAGLTVATELLAHISPLGGPTSFSPANTGGQNADRDLSVRFCPLPESTPTYPSTPTKRAAWLPKETSSTEGTI